MAQTLKLTNFGSNNTLAQTKLTGDLGAGVTALPVVNSVNFLENLITLIGAAGAQGSEIQTTAAPADSTTVTLTEVTSLQHNNGDPVTLLVGDRIRVYRAADAYNNGTQPPDTDFEAINGTTGTAIDPSQALTLYTDDGGNSTFWYKYTYYNSVSSAETDLASSTAVWASQVHYVSLDQVRRAAGLTNSPNVTDDLIAEFRDAAEKEINGALLPVYDFPLPKPTNPIIVEIAKNIAAGELKHEMYQNVSVAQATAGETLADKARNGGGSHTSLQDLVLRDVVLEDANFNEETIDEGHGFGGWPDDTTKGAGRSQGGDSGPQFSIDEEY